MPPPPEGVPAGAGTSTEHSFSARLGRRAARGDQRAFETIFKKYHQELYRYCLAIVRDREDAEDALQATMAAALRSLPGEKRDIPLRPWLYRVAHNESVSLLRARTQAAEAEDADPVTAMTGSVVAEVEGRDRLRQLVSDLQDLPERQRSAIVMRELNDLSYAEIATSLNCSEGAARQTIYEARTTLFTFEEGRAMECDPIREAISSRDGRRLRGRKVRAHLRVCEGCRNFEAVMTQRRTDLHALVPALPAMAASGMLAGLVGGSGSATVAGAGAGAGVAGVGGASSGLLGSGIAGGLALKGASLIAVAAVAAGAADLGGVIDLPNPFSGEDTAREDGTSEKGSGGATSSGNDEAGSATGGSSAGGAAGGAADGRDAGRQGQGADGRGNSADAPGKGGSDGAAAANGQGHSGAAPGQTGSTPGQSGSTPGQGGSAPGQGGNAPGQGGSTPGQGGSTPGQSGSTPGQSGNTPGQSGSTPGQSGSTPGQSGTSPGKSESAPGHSGSSPGNSGSAPGQTGTTPGQSGSAPPGQAGTTPGQSGTTPGQSGSAPGQSGTAPGSSGSAPGQVKPPGAPAAPDPPGGGKPDLGDLAVGALTP